MGAVGRVAGSGLRPRAPLGAASEIVRIRCFVTGYVRPKAGRKGARRYLVDDWCEQALPVNAFLVEHPAGLTLFDTGQTARAAAAGWFPRWHPFFRLSRFELTPEDEVAPQLRSAGIDPADIRRVVLSHLHTDHVGGLDAFAHAEVVVGREEWESATGVAGRIRGYLPQYWPPGLKPTIVDFGGPAIGPGVPLRDWWPRGGRCAPAHGHHSPR